MRHIIGALYLITALVGCYWAAYLTMTGLYGVPFSRWYVVLYIGSLVLLIGSILWWTTSKEWTRLFPIVGSAFLCSYFVPAFITVLREDRVDVIRVIILILVITSLIVAIMSRHVIVHPPPQANG